MFIAAIDSYPKLESGVSTVTHWIKYLALFLQWLWGANSLHGLGTSYSMSVVKKKKKNKNCKPFKCALTDKWINNPWNIHTTEYYSSIKKSGLPIFTKTWMNLFFYIWISGVQHYNWTSTYTTKWQPPQVYLPSIAMWLAPFTHFAHHLPKHEWISNALYWMKESRLKEIHSV